MLYAKKLDNQDEMETFLERHKISKLIQKEIRNLEKLNFAKWLFCPPRKREETV